jgi:hypothetical protein
MSEEMARALGADSPKPPLMIAGKPCTIRPLGIKELTEVQRDCVERYKRTYLKTFADNLDLLPTTEEKKLSMMEKKMEQVARWDAKSLPPKDTCDPNRLVVNQVLKDWLKDTFSITDNKDDEHWRYLAATALDAGTLSSAEYELMAGQRPARIRIPYDSWWVTGCYEGMITFAWACFKHCGVTREEIESDLGKQMSDLVKATREIEKVTAPQLGNG